MKTALILRRTMARWFRRTRRKPLFVTRNLQRSPPPPPLTSTATTNTTSTSISPSSSSSSNSSSLSLPYISTLTVVVAVALVVQQLRLCPSVSASSRSDPSSDVPPQHRTNAGGSGGRSYARQPFNGANNGGVGAKKCTNCMQSADEMQRQAVDNLRIEAIKHQILSKLGLKHKPNITTSIPREIVLDTLWRADEGMDLLSPRIQGTRPQSDIADDYYARTSEIITFAEPGGLLNGQTLLQFSNRHDNPHSLRVKGATLWVQLKFRAPLARHFRHVFHDRKITLYVFRVVRLGNETFTSSSNGLTMELITSARMSIKHVGWKKFDLQETVQKWFVGPLGQKLSLLIDCAGCGTLVQPIFFAEDVKDPPNRRHSDALAAARGYRPFLAIVTEPVPLHRVRRRALDCDSRTTQCCKKSLYVSFKLLQWDDWIIAPQGYYANYCMGDCSRRGRTPDTFSRFHTHVIEEYRNRNPYAVISQCCAPSKLASMSLIYFDQDLNIIKTDLPNMIVDECGCA